MGIYFHLSLYSDNFYTIFKQYSGIISDYLFGMNPCYKTHFQYCLHCSILHLCGEIKEEERAKRRFELVYHIIKKKINKITFTTHKQQKQ